MFEPLKILGAIRMPGKRNANILPKLGERLKKWRKDQSLRLADVSKMIKGTSGPLSEIENNKSYPTVETIAMFHKRTNLNVMWLLFNEGEMLKKKTKNK